MLTKRQRFIARSMVWLKLWIPFVQMNQLCMRPRRGTRWLLKMLRERQAVDNLRHAPACPANHYHRGRLVFQRCNCGAWREMYSQGPIMIIKSIVNTGSGRQVTISGDPADVDRITAIMQAVGPDVDVEKLKRLMFGSGTRQAKFDILLPAAQQASDLLDAIRKDTPWVVSPGCREIYQAVDKDLKAVLEAVTK